MRVLKIAATQIAEKTAPVWATSNPYLVSKIKGIAEKRRYKQAQAKVIQRLKKKTTGSVSRR